MKISPYRVGIVIILLVVTSISLHGSSGIRATKIKHPLSTFPTQLGTWKKVESRSSSAKVIKLLGVDDYIDYTYANLQGDMINLYVGFYEYIGNGKGYHSPKNCLPGGGWGISEEKEIQITLDSKENIPVTVSEMIIRQGDDYQVVLYWFQNRGRIIASEYIEKIYLVLDSLLKKRTDGSFVRLMTHAPHGDIEKAESLLKNFAGMSIAELEKYLPGLNER